MNNQALVSRVDSGSLPQWNAQSPGYLGLNNGSLGGGGMGGGEPAQNRAMSHVLSALRRNWWMVAITWAVIAIPSTIFVYKQLSPEYVAVNAINVAPTTINPVSGGEHATAFYTEYLRTQAELMKSPAVLQKATENPRFKAYAWFRQLPDQVGYLMSHVTVTPIGSTQNIEISMSHPDAAVATDVVDSVIDAYMDKRKGFDDQTLSDSLAILTKLQKTTSASLEEDRAALAKQTADGNGAWSEQDQKVLGEVISNAKQTLSKLQTDAMNLQNQLEDVKERPVPDKTTYEASIPTDADGQINQWMSEAIRVQVLDNVLSSKHATIQHPDRVEYRKQLKVLNDKIAARRQELRDTAWGNYQAGYELDRTKKIQDSTADIASVNRQITTLQKRIDEQEGLAKQVGSKVQTITALQDQIADSKLALKHYDDRIQEISIQNQAPGRVSSFGPTVQPKTPDKDRRPKLALAANGFGLLAGLGLVIMLTKIRNRIEHPEDLGGSYQPLIVGTVSHAGMAARGLPGRMGRKILGEEMRLLHANLLPPGHSERRIMMITSPTPSNGKTSIASQLALSLAKSGLKVLLIDADLRKRDLSTMYDVGFRPGLSDLLQGREPELIRPVELLPNLQLIGAGSRLDRNPVELFQRRHFSEALGMLKENFDCIVVDTPPTLVVADSRLIAASVDEVLCVVRAQVTSSKELDATVDALQRVTGRAPKIIVNGVAHRQSYYKYKYAYTENTVENVADEALAATNGSLD